MIKHYSNDNNCNLSNFVMIGDQKYDITGAMEAGIDSVGVLYGYGSEAEITGSKPTFIVRSN
ncbi:MAG: HAD hydrolase-like protein [Nitrososphaerales archaeon]